MPKNDFKTAIVLPFFNAEKTLKSAIESVLNQTLKNFNFILVDNNSTDKSMAIAKQFASQDRRITLLYEAQQGVAFASNRGMQFAHNKYIARTDADDTLHPNRLLAQQNFLTQNPQIDLLATQANYVGAEENIGFKTYVELTNKVLSHEAIYLNQFTELQTINPTIMFRKSSAERFGYYKHDDFPEDYELFLRWLSLGAKMQKLPHQLLNWQDSPTRLTRTDAHYTFDAFYKCKSPYLAKFLMTKNPFHPKIVVWGAGRKSRQRAKLLEKYGIEITAFIDIDKKKLFRNNDIYFKDLPKAGQIFIVSYVSNRGAKEKIRAELKKLNYTEGLDFILAA